MLSEAVEIIPACGPAGSEPPPPTLPGGLGQALGSARPRLGIAASGVQSCALAAQHADCLVAVEPSPEFVDLRGSRWAAGARIGQLPIGYDRDRDTAIERAAEFIEWWQRELGPALNA